MRKVEIVQRIVQETGCTTTQAAAAVEATLTVIKLLVGHKYAFMENHGA